MTYSGISMLNLSFVMFSSFPLVYLLLFQQFHYSNFLFSIFSVLGELWIIINFSKHEENLQRQQTKDSYDYLSQPLPLSLACCLSLITSFLFLVCIGVVFGPVYSYLHIHPHRSVEDLRSDYTTEYQQSHKKNNSNVGNKRLLFFKIRRLII